MTRIRVQTLNAVLVLEKITSYPRFSLYQVYRESGKTLLPIYRTSFTDMQLRDYLNDCDVFKARSERNSMAAKSQWEKKKNGVKSV